ncbi:MAG: hypothetical protein KJ950_01370 [Proteobacteria bacterium]|nr:hypothetical protein [Pseudomonadota bacterium]MBU1686306.1 hypothetical protein [Pseudomonadota bacterium]
MGNDEESSFALDKSAEEIYQQLEGIDDTVRVDLSMKLESELMQFLQDEEKKRDSFRLLIAQTASLFADILVETKMSALNSANNHKLRVLLNTLTNISALSDMENKITCRYRGQQTIQEDSNSPTKTPETYDYELSIDNILLDFQVAQKVEQREPVKGKSLTTKLIKAFTTLSDMQIFNFTIYIKPGEDGTSLKKHEKSINTLLRFYTSKPEQENFLVLDEYDQPNINLTLLAATNRVRAGSLQKLVDLIKPRMLGPEPAPELIRFTTAYDVILATKRYQQQLKKGVIEVNSVHQLMLNSNINPRRNAEAVQVSRLVLAKYGTDPKKVSEVISSISSEGYHNIQSKIMGKRLAQATEFLALAEENENKDLLQQEAMLSIEEGLENIPDEVYNELNIEGDEISTVDSLGRKTNWSLHQKIFGLVSYFKQRSLTKQKVHDINNRAVQFDAVDYSVIARNSNITIEEAEHLVELLKECFSESGRYRRSSFEKNIPEFLKYEDKVFEFLWYYMKGLRIKEDRISFLNSIQILVSQLKTPEKALTIILTDIFNPAFPGRFSDRNGFILANILLRTYNQEVKSNIELTPEEVLYVWAGLNKEMVKVAQQFFHRNREQVLQKVKRMTQLMLQLSIEKVHQEEQMQLRFLLYLMREVVMFCSLIGGNISLSTVKGVVQEFGNPHSPFYRKIEKKSNISQGLKLLQVAARGLKRFHDPICLELLRRIAGMEQEFIDLYDNQTHRDTVKKVLDRVVKEDI